MFGGSPNISGEFGYSRGEDGYNYGSGAFSSTTTTTGLSYNGSKNVTPKKWTYYASRSSSTYGNSTTVQAPALLTLDVIKF